MPSYLALTLTPVLKCVQVLTPYICEHNYLEIVSVKVTQVRWSCMALTGLAPLLEKEEGDSDTEMQGKGHVKTEANLKVM